MRLTGAIVALAVMLVACSPGPPPDATGEEIYLQLCSRCHGEDLGGGVAPELGPGSGLLTESDDYIEFTVVNGRGRMPSFPALEEDQIDRLIEYIREVQGG